MPCGANGKRAQRVIAEKKLSCACGSQLGIVSSETERALPIGERQGALFSHIRRATRQPQQRKSARGLIPTDAILAIKISGYIKWVLYTSSSFHSTTSPILRVSFMSITRWFDEPQKRNVMS